MTDDDDTPQQRRAGGLGRRELDKKSVFRIRSNDQADTAPGSAIRRNPAGLGLARRLEHRPCLRHNLCDGRGELRWARVTPGDASIAETQITTDGEQHFGYDRRLQDEDKRALRKDSKDDKHKMGQRVPSIQIVWARDSKHFAVVRRDERKVSDLFVINALSTPRPTLETYRYAMPGEANIPQPQIEVFDLATKGRIKVKADRFVDQSLQIAAAPATALGREKDKTEPQWVAEGSDKLTSSAQPRSPPIRPYLADAKPASQDDHRRR